MNEKEVEMDGVKDSNDIHTQLEASINQMESVENGNVTGTVVEVRDDTVFVDIGLGRDGQIRISEFGDEIPNVGDKVTVFLKNPSGKDGLPEVSKLKEIGRAHV